MIKTTLHSYYISDSATMAKELHSRLKKTNGKCFNTWGQGSHYLSTPEGGCEVWLDDKQFWSNQWNTTEDSPNYPNRRVFDWAQDADKVQNGTYRGHFLEITDEMRRIRDETLACGFCGHRVHVAESDSFFCHKCLGSRYLSENQLELLKLLPVSSDREMRKVSELELIEIQDAYIDAQLASLFHDGTEKAVQKRDKVLAKVAQDVDRKVATALAEKAGFGWLAERKIDLGQVIFFDHSNEFCFGWDVPYPKFVADRIRSILADFPFSYRIKEEK